MKKCVSVFMVLIMALSIVLGSFSVAFAANNDGTSFLYIGSTYKYSFDELLDEFLQTCDEFGTVFTYQDVFFVFDSSRNAYYPVYNKNIESTNWSASFLGKENRSEVVQQATSIVNHLGYAFWLYPERSLVGIYDGGSSLIAGHYYTGADGNRLMSGGGGSGAGREHPYYTTPGTDNTLPGSGDNYYMGDTVTTQIIDNSTGAFNNIGNDNVINAGEGDFIYNPDNRTWYVTSHEDNRTYTTNNYYTYNTVNYYMPGSDQPLNTWNYFYELPDGRNSATLTEEDIAGLNLDFDVVNYKSATEDLTQKALFHFDGNIENSAPPSNRVIVPGTEYFNFTTWSARGYYYNGDDWVTSNTRFSKDTSNSTFVLNTTSSASHVVGNIYPSVSTPFEAGMYIVSFDIEGLNQLNSNETVYVWFDNHQNGFDGGFDSVRLTNTSNSTFSFVYEPDYTWSTPCLHVELISTSARTLVISNVSIALSAWGEGEGGAQAEFEFTNGAGYTFVDTQTPFDAALYLDGLAHTAWFDLPDDSLTSGGDFTFSYRYYNEVSTSTDPSYFRLGRNRTVLNNFIYVKFDGYRITQFGTYDDSGVSVSSINKTIPPGQWNTITITRSGNTLILYLNGLQIASVTDSLGITLDVDLIELELAADNNVKYLDEVLFASQALYTENHVPRLIPWDTTNVLVLPDVTENSIAVQATFPITGWRIGGVRPTFPDEGIVWMMVEGDFITMIQIYNGYMWVQVNGAVYYNGHWYQLENFNIHVSYDDIDTPPDSDVVNPNDQNNNPDSSGGSGGSGGGWFQDILKQLLSGIIDIIMDLIKALVSLIGRVLNAIIDFLGAIAFNIVGLFDFMSPIAGFTTGFFGALPADIQTVYVSAFALLVFAGILLFIGKH